MTTTTHRSAEQIGHTERGPRPLPPLGEHRVSATPQTLDTVLDNGLRLLVVRKPAVPMVELRLRIPFGGTEKTHPARAELLAETVLTGTARRSRVQVDTDLAMVGGELGTGVDPERFSMGGSALASGLGRLLDVLADVLTAPAYADDEVARERDRLVERITMSEAQPGMIARKALQRRRYGDHPFAHEMPEAADVADVTPEQVRELHRKSVVPRGSVLVLVGDVDPDGVRQLVNHALAGWRSDTPATEMAPLPEVVGGNLLLVHRPGAVQSQLRLSARAVSRTDPRYAAQQMANLAFGGYFSSRLVENIREDKGYTYHARSYLEFTPSGASLLVDADTASGVTAAALWETRYELGRLGLVPPTDAEVESVRQYAIGSLLISTSSQSGLASQLVTLAGLGLDADWLRGHPDRLAAVTVDDVAEVALEFFAPTAFTGVVVGDAEALSTQLAAIGGVELP
ncbi:MAG TPA: pitrilysin family protein [Pseudonocardiaceae bacterium]|jgi:predicted Zn-dependent peptidase|nr:pitrilysin family protein [Pseudonocardiaceae bacterium]